MANRMRGYGYSAEVQKKLEAKYNSREQAQVQEWINSVLGEEVFSVDAEVKPNDFQAKLKDGVVLCRVIDTLKPGLVGKINHTKMNSFQMRENIEKFLKGCYSLGVKTNDTFQTVDLFEGGNIPQVISGIIALGRKANASGLTDLKLGAKEAQTNKREFTEEQMKEGQKIVGLQMGSNKGASQSGDRFGRPRQIAGVNAYK